jgi:hypothetical protein
MRKRPGRTPALAFAAAAIAFAAAALAGCGGDDRSGEGDLVWEKEPRIYRPPNLPDDRILQGRVRNDSLKPVELDARDLRVEDEDGDSLKSAGSFLQSFARGLYPPTREPDPVPEDELLRTGRKARIEPGKSVPVTVSWRETNGRAGARVRYDGASLPIPDG